MHCPISGLEFLNPTFLLHFCVKTSVLATRLPDPSKSNVEEFLRLLHTAMGTEKPTIIFENRPENRQGIADLHLKTYSDGIPYIRGLALDHASHVLQSDDKQEAADGRHLWVFGVLIGKPGKKQRPAYVKVQLGRSLAEPLCISFHPPMFRLSFLFPSDCSTLFQKLFDNEQSKHR